MTQSWTINGNNSSSAVKKSNCTTIYILGGSAFVNFATSNNSYFVSKQFSSLPSHNVAYFEVDLFFLKPGFLVLRIEIDGQQVFRANVSDLVTNENTYIVCDGSQYLKVTLPGKIPHSNANLTLTVISEGQSKFGIRNIKMRFATDLAINAITPCIKTLNSNTQEGTCNCTLGRFYDSSGNCQQCDFDCGQCFGPTQSECFGCAPGHVYDPINRICIACTNNCLLCTGPEVDQCLQCSSGYYLLINNSCSLTCDSSFYPVQNGAFRTCNTPCQSSQYFTEDGSCSTTCNPLLVKTVAGNKLCKSPCQLHQYIYPDGSCSDSCPVNSTNDGIYRFCGCPLGSVMLPDASCVQDCPYPYQAAGNPSICGNPCPEDYQYFYQKDEQCRAECDPSQVQESFICLDDPSGTQNEGQPLAQLTSGVSSFASGLSTVATLANANNPSALLLTSFSEMTGYIKYLKIDYPSKLQDALDQDSGSFQIIPEASDSLRKQIVNSTLPEKFEDYNDHSSFLVNFYSHLITLLILAIITVIVLLIKACKKNKEALNNVKDILMWNFSLPFFSTQIGNIVLYSSFEFRTAGSISGFLSVLSMIICCVFNLIVIAALAKMLIVIRTRWTKILKTPNLDNNSVETVKTSLSSYQTVFDRYRDRLILQQAFMFIFVARVYIYVFIISYLYDYPLAQSILIMLLSFFMLVYLIITRPFIHRVDLASYLIQELALLIVLICTLILASMDSNDPANDNARENLSQVILTTNFVFSLISSAYAINTVAPLLKNIFMKFLNCFKKKEVTPSAPTETKQIQIRRKNNASLDHSQKSDTSRQLFTVKPSDVSMSNFSHRIVSSDVSFQTSHRDRVLPSADSSFQTSFTRRIYPVRPSQIDL